MSAGEAAPRHTTGICELTLETVDIDALERFYVDVLGLRVIDRSADRVWLSCGERARLGLWSPGRKEHGDEGGRHVHFALSATPGALDEVARRAERAGADAHGPVEHDGGDRSMYVRDPAGNVVEVWDFFESGAGARDGVGQLARD